MVALPILLQLWDLLLAAHLLQAAVGLTSGMSLGSALSTRSGFKPTTLPSRSCGLVWSGLIAVPGSVRAKKLSLFPAYPAYQVQSL